MSDIAIKVESLSKRYRIGLLDQQHDTLKEAVTSWLRKPADKFRQLRKLGRFEEEEADDVIWALRDVSFEVKVGEVVGVVGRNGAGKSTLLKLLSRITEPTSGRILLNGRVASLLEVGTGFHPELTGRENVYLNGTILGMTKQEIDRKFDEIVAFSGVEKFIDTPVKRYSSGMKVRLAFAVAAHLEPEILLIDEVLSVGDFEFQRKCLGKMDEVAARGRTVLFVSHQLQMVQHLCERTLLLEKGSLKLDGRTTKVIDAYLGGVEKLQEIPLAHRKDRDGSQEFIYTDFWITDKNGHRLDAIRSGDDVNFHFVIRGDGPPLEADINVAFFSRHHGKLFSCASGFYNQSFMLHGETEVVISVPRFPLNSGTYKIQLLLLGGYKAKRVTIDKVDEACQLEVVSGDFFGTGRTQQTGVFLVDHRIQARTNSGRDIFESCGWYLREQVPRQ